ncbi:PrpR N-terminal domain-containing protein [Terribacillus sp. JSM ZJ617]|uniref:PrpR N-terminal domain-containing protein n=1 Tax=Terribacillus sp. JSM ZJ617 TaxID=3342119 RepID=UPI0035A875D2
MSSKVLILSHPKLTHVVQQVMDSMDQLPDVTIRDVSFGGVVHFLNTHLQTIKPNMIITGGAHWTMLDRSNYRSDLPILPIPITRYDLLQAALQARQFGKKIAVVHYGEELQSCQDALLTLDGEYEYFSYRSQEEAASLLLSLKQSGTDAIIGGGLICSLADENEIPSVFLHSKDSIMKILEHVARLETSRQEIEQVTQKWAKEFMRHPLHSYEVSSYSAGNTAMPLPQHPIPTKSKSDIDIALDKFMFHQSLVTEKSTRFVSNSCFPFAFAGIFTSEEGTEHLTTTIKKLEASRDEPLFYAIEDKECHVLFLSKLPSSNTLLNIPCPDKLAGGISSSSPTADMLSSETLLSEKVWEAQVAMELVNSRAVSDSLCILGEGSPFHMLLPLLRTDSLPQIKLIKPLFELKNTARLLQILRLLLDHGLSITTVAHHVGTSRQTVYGYMDRIESVIGLLSDPEKRFALSLELRIWALQSAVEQLRQKDSLAYEKSERVSI